MSRIIFYIMNGIFINGFSQYNNEKSYSNNKNIINKC